MLRFIGALCLSQALIPVSAQAISMSDLKSAALRSRSEVSSARIDFTYERIRAEPSRPLELDTRDPSVRALDTYENLHILATIDLETEREKYSQKDLRNVNELIAASGLDIKQWVNINRTYSRAKHGKSMMDLRNLSPPGSEDDHYLHLMDSRNPIALSFPLKKAGQISQHHLSEGWGQEITESSREGKQMITLTAKRLDDAGGGLTVVYECDPSLGYRYRSRRVLRNGKVTYECEASDFKKIDGIPFPFTFVKRVTDEGGDVAWEKVYETKTVELNVNLTPDDFKLRVPAGTRMSTDQMNREVKTSQDHHIGVDEVRDTIAYELSLIDIESLNVLESLASREPEDSERAVFIPNSNLNDASSHILDLQTGAIVQSPENLALCSQDMSNHLLQTGLGDVAYDGGLILYRIDQMLVKKEFKGTVEKRAWGRYMKLPDHIELPFSFFLMTSEHAHFQFKIVRFDHKGIQVRFKRLGKR